MKRQLKAVARRALGREEWIPLLESDRFGFDARWDLTAAEVDANARSLEPWRAADDFQIRTIQWLVPAFDHAAYGGIHTILRFADGFARHGAANRFHLYDATAPGQPEAIAQRIAAAFPSLAGAPVTGAADLGVLPPCDAAIATFWPTAYVLARLHQARSKFVFVQDRESGFYPAGAAAALAEQTLRLGFPAIVNSPALEGVAGDGPSVTFTPSVDTGLYRPPAEPRPGRPFRLVIYARPSAIRNAYGLGLATLRRVKEAYGDRVELLAAGEEWDPRRFHVEGAVRNLGLLPDLPAVAELYRSCHAGLFFMMTPHASYQPLELMASGAACVSNESATTGWLLEHERTALLAPPLASLVADQVGRLIDDPALRDRLAAAGRERVCALPAWDGEIDRVWAFMTKAL